MSLAIKYAMRKKARMRDENREGHQEHKAHGGACMAHGSPNCHMCHGGKYAQGGFVHEEKETGYGAMPKEHEKHDEMAIREDDRMLNQHGAHEIAAQGMDEDDEHHQEKHYAHAEENQGFPHEEHDMVSRIMKQRQHHYSHGGKVANRSEVEADFEPNEFDDLSKDDDLEQHYTGANSGDEIGDVQEDEDRHDIIERIMRSRRKKDRMPIPA